MSGKSASLPEWEAVLSAAAHLLQILPDAVLDGGTAAAIHARHRLSPERHWHGCLADSVSAIHARHRLSQDADHVLTDLRQRFDQILAQLESVAGWRTARVAQPVLILGSLDGIETGVRQLIRETPLETTTLSAQGVAVTVPTEAEILRIKGVLILRRNATRDYLDFAALAERMGNEAGARALGDFDRLYPQANGESSLQQLQAQLANPLPYDLEETELREYKNLAPRWHDWNAVKAVCAHTAAMAFDYVCTECGP